MPLAQALLRRVARLGPSPPAQLRWGCASLYTGFGRQGDDDGDEGQRDDAVVPPWASTVLTGVDLIRNSKVCWLGGGLGLGGVS